MAIGSVDTVSKQQTSTSLIEKYSNQLEVVALLLSHQQVKLNQLRDQIVVRLTPRTTAPSNSKGRIQVRLMWLMQAC